MTENDHSPWDGLGTGSVLKSNVKTKLRKEEKRQTLIGELLDVPGQVLQFIRGPLFVRILTQKGGTL